GEYPAARTQFEAALARQPGSPDARLGIARCDARQDRLDAAISTFERLIAENPTFITAHYELSRALLAKGDAARAERYTEIFRRLSEERRQKEAGGAAFQKP